MADAPITPAPAAVEQPVAAPSDTNYLPPPTMQSVAPANLTEAGSAAYGEPGAAAQPSTVVPAGAPAPAQPAPATQPGFFGRHQVLARMVTGLAQGLSAAGAAASTGGREGGAPQIQQQRLQAQAAATQQKAAEQDYAIKTQTLNQMNSANKLNLMTFNDEVAQRHMAAASAQIKTESEAQEVFDTTGRVPTGWYADPTTAQIKQGTQPPVAAPGTPGAAAPGTSVDTPYQRRLNTMLDAFDKELKDDKGNSDPSVQAARQVIADPNSNPSQKQQAIIGLQQKAGMNAQVMKNLTEKADLAAKLQTGVQGAINTEREQLAQNTYNRTVQKNAQGQPVEDFATWQARSTKTAEVAAQQGDPTALGEMAADGLITIPQIAMGRQLDKPGFQKLIAAADAKAKANGAPEITVNGKGTGHYFNANAATQQFDYVKAFNAPGSKTQQSIASGSTFMEHMSDLLDVNAEYGRTNNKILNTPLNKIADTFGNETYTKLMAAIAPVKTEYDNALKAGFAPTAEDAATVDLLLKPNSTPGQIETAGKVMAHTILRRLDSTNQGYKTHTGGVDYPNMLTPDAAAALDKMGIPTGGLQSGGSFGGPAQAGVTAGKTQAAVVPKASNFTRPANHSANAKLMQIPGKQPVWVEPMNQKAAQNLGAVEVQ